MKLKIKLLSENPWKRINRGKTINFESGIPVCVFQEKKMSGRKVEFFEWHSHLGVDSLCMSV